MPQTEGGYGTATDKRVELVEHMRYLPMGYFNAGSLGEIASVTTNTMENLQGVATRVIMLISEGVLTTAIIAAIPFTMYLAKVRKPGMLFISSVIIGALMLLTGMGFYALVLSVVTGIVAELIWRSGGYTSVSKVAPTYAVFNLWMWANYLPLFLDREAYVAARPDYGDAYWQALETLLSPWMLAVLALACIVFSVLGALYAKKVLARKMAPRA